MADQKTEDTKSPLPRRGARPFAGPAAARPFLRPVTTPQRATAAPFVPPVVPGKPALGIPTSTARAPEPAATQAIPQAIPQAIQHAIPQPAPQAVPAADADALPPTRPVTSEMIALDAFDAFDTVWEATEAPVAAPEPQAAAAPLDELSLGSGTDAHQLWADEITGSAAIAATGEPEAPPATAAEPTYSTPSSAMPAWLEHDVAPGPEATSDSVTASEPSAPVLEAPDASPASPVAEQDVAYSITEWTEAHAIPSADELEPASAAWPESPLVEQTLGDALSDVSPDVPAEPLAGTSEERPRFELVRESQETEAVPDAAHDPRTVRDMRCAAALDRLAHRIRSGEIDVSFIAPDAPDAAILASVLAALLGGSSSR